MSKTEDPKKRKLISIGAILLNLGILFFFKYFNFFGENLVPLVKSVLLENNKKNVKKLFDVFQNGYVQGDRDTVNVIVAVIAAACVKDDTAKANAIAALGDNKHFIDSVTQFIPIVASNKKLSASLLK